MQETDSIQGSDEMAINGLNQYDLFSSYNSINAMERIPKAEPSDVSKQEQESGVGLAKANQQEPSKPLALNLESIRPRFNASLESISLSLKSNTEFDMKGRDSSLSSLDMEKAVSDMQKDQALIQYQYFVGDSNVINSNEDGTVIQKIPQESF